MTNGKRRRPKKPGGQILSFMVCFLFLFFSLVAAALVSLFLLDDAHAARRRYKNDLDLIKPDLVAYNKQKEVALGLPPGTLVRQVAGPSKSGTPSMQVHYPPSPPFKWRDLNLLCFVILGGPNTSTATTCRGEPLSGRKHTCVCR